MSDSIAQRKTDTPKKYQQAYMKSVSGDASPREAIKSFCLECMGWMRTEVTKCDTVACPLNYYRPYQEKSDAESG
jgi:hypothetical protein